MEQNKPNEIYINRIFDAPLKVVWNAWVEPDQVGQWWGPRGFTITTHSKDVRTGGTWDYVMHGPDGVDYPNTTKFLEVIKYSRMVYDHGSHGDRRPLFRVTVNFTEVDGKTKMEMSMALPTPEVAKETKKFIKKAGGDATWDRLAEYLSESPRFVINRSFEAPISVMFQMWTNPNHLSKWLAPTGSTMQFIRSDIRVGSSSFFSMTNEDGKMLWGKISYKEITEPSRIVYSQIFCDENENVSRHPMAPVWPETMHTTVSLTEEGPNRTRVTIVWEPSADANAAEREMFLNSRGGMTQGWSGSFEKLEEILQVQK